MRNREKKVIFSIIVFVVVVLVLGIFVSTVYRHIFSWSKGIVHWHAGLKINICGGEARLPSPEKWYENKLGTVDLHHHDDMRIHIEGIVMKREDASLGRFFDVVGIEFTDHSIWGWRNGDVCPDGSSGSLKMFVNGRPNYEFRDYVIGPYFTSEDEDKIELIFD